MKSARKDLRNRALAALLAVAVLTAAGTAVLRVVGNEYRRNLADHLLSNLEALERVLGLLQQDSADRVRLIVEEPEQRRLSLALLADAGARERHRRYRDWITPFYRSRGFEDYSLISADGQRIVAAGSAELVGRETLPATRDALRLAELMGSATTRPISGRHPALGADIANPAAAVVQWSCVRIDRGLDLLGFLCLHENPLLRLYKLLRAGRPGLSGEAYAIDGEGRILSPIRFERRLAAPENSEAGWSLLNVFARVPARTGVTAAPGAPLTAVAARLLAGDALHTGLLEDYADYRGRKVIGAGRWLPDTSMGIVIEVDMDEAFRSYHFARNTLIALIALGWLLIAALTYLDLRSRRSLARSERQLAAFRDHIPAELHMKSAAGRYLMTNPVYESFFKAPPQSLLGKTDADLYPPEAAREREREHDEVVRTGRPLHRIHTKRAEDGGEATYSIVRFPVLGGDDAVVAVGTVGLNVTEQLRTQRELEELTRTLEDKVAKRTAQLAAARDLAEAGSRAKAEFLATMSHEIRTPLNAIIGMGHLAAHANAAPRVAHYIERIQSSSRHLLTIVNDILDLSKIEAGKQSIAAVEFALESLLGHVVALTLDPAEAKGLQLRVEVEGGLPARFIGDAMRIGQILINFANNAVKFTDRGEIALRARSTGRYKEENEEKIVLRFEVEDSGIGIAADKLPLLFSPFQQLDGSMARRFEGSGLGLAISRNLAELMGGEVGVASQAGRGSLFWLELALVAGAPATPSTPGSGGAADLHAARAAFAGRSILLVEDNPINREVVQGLLEMAGARAAIAEDGAQALALLHRQSFDAVLMDVHLPVMDGFAATAQIRREAKFSALPIIALTANALEGDRERCLAAGMNDYVAKPIEPAQLFAALSRHLPARMTENAADAAIVAAMAAVPGIDTRLALSRMMGRRDLYARLVRRIVEERAEAAHALAQACRDGDHAAMSDSIHTAKSLLGALGATELAQRCVELQGELRAGRVDAESIKRFAADYGMLLHRLREIAGD